MSEAYVHGYHPRENERLRDQSGTLVNPLHHDTSYAARSVVLEVGCGVGAQIITLASTEFGRDSRRLMSEDSIAEAKRTTDAAGLANVAAIFRLALLEHLSRPVEALAILNKLLRPGGTMTVIEGDHGSTYFHPDSSAAQMAFQCQVAL